MIAGDNNTILNISFPTTGTDLIPFKTSHITSDMLVRIFKHPHIEDLLCDLYEKIIEQDENRIVRKPNARSPLSQVKVETGEWRTLPDCEVYHKVGRGVSAKAKSLATKNKVPLNCVQIKDLRELSINCEMAVYMDDPSLYVDKGKTTRTLRKLKNATAKATKAAAANAQVEAST